MTTLRDGLGYGVQYNRFLEPKVHTGFWRLQEQLGTQSSFESCLLSSVPRLCPQLVKNVKDI
jgi:hypothetical protein